jgi:hypothetical protein
LATPGELKREAVAGPQVAARMGDDDWMFRTDPVEVSPSRVPAQQRVAIAHPIDREPFGRLGRFLLEGVNPVVHRLHPEQVHGRPEPILRIHRRRMAMRVDEPRRYCLALEIDDARSRGDVGLDVAVGADRK